MSDSAEKILAVGLRPANSNALPLPPVDPKAIPFCAKCSPTAKRRQSGGREWLEYNQQPACADCPRQRRLKPLYGRSPSVAQAEEVRRVHGIRRDSILYDFGFEPNCRPRIATDVVLEDS